jgi:arginine/ornithine transport system permease protein
MFECIAQLWDSSIITTEFHRFWPGLGMTLQLLIVSLLLSFLFALPLSIMRVSSNKWISAPVWLYTYVFRGTPMLVQLYIVYQGTGSIEWIKDTFLWDSQLKLFGELSILGLFTIDGTFKFGFVNPFFCAVFTFALNSCAYTTEMLAGTLKSTYSGEVEAAKAYGMSKSTMFRRILIPSALRRAIPSYSNEFMFMLHGSALASYVALSDLLGVARDIQGIYYKSFEAFSMAAVFYISLTLIMMGGFKLAEKRWLAYLAPRKN